MSKLLTFAEGELESAVVQELCRGWLYEEAQGRARERAAAAEARGMKGHKSIDGMGKCIGAIPEEDYFRIIAKEGPGFFQDKANVRQFFQRHPHLRANNI